MTPRDLIDDLRSRINPAYAAQLGTESYERRLCTEALEAQADEIEKARRTAEYWKAEHLAGNEEIERLRRAGIVVIDAFEALGETTVNVRLLLARANCESAMLELKRILMPNVELTGAALLRRPG